MNTLPVLRHLGGKLRSAEEVEAGLHDDITAFASAAWQRWTIWRVGDARRIGRCGLFSIRALAAPPALRGQREIGWSLAEEFWGNGYATEAAGAVLDYAFQTLGLPMIHAQTSDSNAGSTRLMQRLGFCPRPELGYDDPDYPPQDNPTTVWSLSAEQRSRHA